MSSLRSIIEEYSAFGVEPETIRQNLRKTGFDASTIDMELQKFSSERRRTEHLLSSIFQLRSQGFSAPEIVKILSISDEEYSKYIAHIDALEKMLDDSDRLDLIAERIDKVADEIESLFGVSSVISENREITLEGAKKDSPVEESKETVEPKIPVHLTITTRKPQFSRTRFPLPEFKEEFLYSVPLIDARKRLAYLLNQIDDIQQKLQEVQKEIDEVKHDHLKQLEETRRELNLEQKKISEQIFALIEEKHKNVIDTQFVVMGHKNNVIAATKVTQEIPNAPSAEEKLEKVLELLRRDHEDIYSVVIQQLQEMEKARGTTKEIIGYLAIWPFRADRALRAIDVPKKTFVDKIVDKLHGLFVGVLHLAKRLSKIRFRVEETSKEISELDSLVKHMKLKKAIHEKILSKNYS